MIGKTLVTGGAGYIGSHFVKLLQEEGIEVEVLDDLRRGHAESLAAGIPLHRIDLSNFDSVQNLLTKGYFKNIVHFAAYAYVGESVSDPLLYYRNNVIGGLNLIEAAVASEVPHFILSSTCSIYGNAEIIPISEAHPPDPINPYAKTKLFLENTLEDVAIKGKLKFLALRYFNAAGAHKSGLIGESHDPEPHLIPLVIDAALRGNRAVKVFGNDYPTPDGTCIRDYIHVEDLADAHFFALKRLNEGIDYSVVNLGTGTGTSVKEIIKIVEKVTGTQVKYEIVERREGDPALLVADNKLAQKVLNWSPKHDINSIISSAIYWHKNKKY